MGVYSIFFCELPTKLWNVRFHSFVQFYFLCRLFNGWFINQRENNKVLQANKNNIIASAYSSNLDFLDFFKKKFWKITSLFLINSVANTPAAPDCPSMNLFLTQKHAIPVDYKANWRTNVTTIRPIFLVEWSSLFNSNEKKEGFKNSI